jgi:flagella basal body P-ring formation protein FlgA
MRNPPDAFNLPEGEVEYEVIFGGGRILDARNIAVILRVDGRVVENLRIAGDIKAYLPVVTAARRLNRGDVITKADLVMRRKNIADLGRPFLDFNAADGMVAKRVIPMGHVLEENDLDAPVLVKRREVVTMIAARGNLQVSTRGVAAANGKQGEIISVQNMRSKREVACEVIGRKQVRVEF